MNKNPNYDRIKSLLLPKTGNLIKGFLMLGEFSLVAIRIIKDENGKEIKIYQDDNLHLLVENPNLCLFNLEIFFNPKTGKNNLSISWRDEDNKKQTIKFVQKIHPKTEEDKKTSLTPELINRFLTCKPDNQ